MLFFFTQKKKKAEKGKPCLLKSCTEICLSLFGEQNSSWNIINFFNTWNMQYLQSSCFKKKKERMKKKNLLQYLLSVSWSYEDEWEPCLSMYHKWLIVVLSRIQQTNYFCPKIGYKMDWNNLFPLKHFLQYEKKKASAFVSLHNWELRTAQTLGKQNKSPHKAKARTWQEKAEFSVKYFLIALEYHFVKDKGQ